MTSERIPLAQREGFGDVAQSLRTLSRVFARSAEGPAGAWPDVDQFVIALYLDTRSDVDAPSLSELLFAFRTLALYAAFRAAFRAHLAYRTKEMEFRRSERQRDDEKLSRSLERFISIRMDVAEFLPADQRTALATALEFRAALIRSERAEPRERVRHAPRTLHLAKSFTEEIRDVWSYIHQRDMSRSRDPRMIGFSAAVWRDAGFYEPDTDVFGWLFRRFQEVNPD